MFEDTYMNFFVLLCIYNGFNLGDNHSSITNVIAVMPMAMNLRVLHCFNTKTSYLVILSTSLNHL